MNSLILGGIIKRVYKTFDLSTFNNRLKLQKIIYLIQAYGINLGFTYSMYLRGPYSTQLTKVAFSVSDFNKAKPIFFEDAKKEKQFEKFLRIINNKKDDINFLEVASTIHLVSKTYNLKDKEAIIDKVHEFKSDFKKQYIAKIYSEVESWLLK